LVLTVFEPSIYIDFTGNFWLKKS